MEKLHRADDWLARHDFQSSDTFLKVKTMIDLS